MELQKEPLYTLSPPPPGPLHSEVQRRLRRLAHAPKAVVVAVLDLSVVLGI